MSNEAQRSIDQPEKFELPEDARIIGDFEPSPFLPIRCTEGMLLLKTFGDRTFEIPADQPNTHRYLVIMSSKERAVFDADPASAQATMSELLSTAAREFEAVRFEKETEPRKQSMIETWQGRWIEHIVEQSATDQQESIVDALTLLHDIQRNRDWLKQCSLRSISVGVESAWDSIRDNPELQELTGVLRTIRAYIQQLAEEPEHKLVRALKQDIRAFLTPSEDLAT